MKNKILLTLAGFGVVLIAALLLSNAAPRYGLASPSSDLPNGEFPMYYSNADSVVGTGTKTINYNLRRGLSTNNVTNTLNSITFTDDVYNATLVTPTVSTQVLYYGSANNGATYTTAPIYSFTVVPGAYNASAPKTNIYTITGLPYTDIKRVVQGAHSSCTVATVSSLLVR